MKTRRRMLTSIMIFWSCASLAQPGVALSQIDASEISTIKISAFNSIRSRISVRAHDSIIRGWSYQHGRYQTISVQLDRENARVKSIYVFNEKRKLYQLKQFRADVPHRLFDADDSISFYTGSVGVSTAPTKVCETSVPQMSEVMARINSDLITTRFDKSCSAKKIKLASADLKQILSEESSFMKCALIQDNTDGMLAAMEYWTPESLIENKVIIRCDNSSKSNILGNTINLGSEIDWKNESSRSRVLFHEMLHAGISDENKVQSITDNCKLSTGARTTAMGGDKVSSNTAVDTQKKPISVGSNSPITYREADPQDLTEVHHFITNSPTRAQIITTMASDMGSQVASALAVIPSAQAAIRGVDGAADVSGNVTSYDSSGSPTIALSSGQTIKFSKPFDIPAAKVDQALGVDSSPDAAKAPRTGSGDANVRAGSRTAAGITGGVGDGAWGGGDSGSSSSSGASAPGTASAQQVSNAQIGAQINAQINAQISAQPGIDPKAVGPINTLSDVRRALRSQKKPEFLLEQKWFTQRLSALHVQISSGQKAWGDDNAKTRYDLSQILNQGAGR